MTLDTKIFERKSLAIAKYGTFTPYFVPKKRDDK